MSRELVSTLIWWGWFLVFLVLELPAARGWVPWTTLSQYIWGLEGRWRWFGYAVAAGFTILIVHLVVKKFAWQ